MTEKPFNRRTFIKVTSTSMASILVGCPENGTVKRSQTVPLDDSNPSIPRDSAAAESTASDLSSPPSPVGRRAADARADIDLSTERVQCAPTSRDITGPFWREGIPVRNEFDVYGHRGQRLIITGLVRDVDCQPIPNAVVEMWHAHPTEVSAAALSDSDSVGYDTRGTEFRYYGQFATNHLGEYSMSTKKPGWYLNGENFRPSHIHVRVYVQGVERLTTQLYFENDPFIAGDPWASEAPERAVALSADALGQLSGTFNFSLS